MKNFKKYGGFLSLILVAVAIIMLFIEPALNYKYGPISYEMDISAFKVIFGIDSGNISEFDVDKMNVMGGIASGLLVLGTIMSLLNFGKAIDLLAAIALIVGGVLLFVFPSTIDAVLPNANFSAAWPLIVSGILGILAGVINLGKTIV